MIFETPLGMAGVGMSGKRIYRIVLPRKGAEAVRRELEEDTARREEAPSAAGMNRAVSLLTKYFSGKPVSFDLPLDLGYYTPFQQAVWTAAARIPYGETRSYGWIAEQIGSPRAARAVGQALGANPFPVIVPCHRVISSAGTLGGFSGGLGMKKRLLDLEAGCHGDAVIGRRADRVKKI